MAEWKTLVDGMTRHERDRVWPGMHKDLIPATEMIDAMDRQAPPQAGLGTSQSPGYAGDLNTFPTGRKTGFGLGNTSTVAVPPDQVGASPAGLPGQPPSGMIATEQGDPWPRGVTWKRELDIGVPVLFTVDTIFPDPSVTTAFLNTKYRFKVSYPDANSRQGETETRDNATGPQDIHVEAAPLPGEKTSTISVEITPISGPLKARLTRFLI